MLHAHFHALLQRVPGLFDRQHTPDPAVRLGVDLFLSCFLHRCFSPSHAPIQPLILHARQSVSPAWPRLLQLSGLLDLGLEALTAEWAAGRIVFAAADLRSLVRALFANSDLRARCLARIVE